MKINYDRESDILTIDLKPGGQIDHAEQTDNVIIHFSPDNKPILLEILKASDFLTEVLRAQREGLRPGESEPISDWDARWDALAEKVSQAWKSEKSAIEILAEMRR